MLSPSQKNSISEAAASLFSPADQIASLTGKRNGTYDIQRRTSKGIAVTREGEEFLGYARQVIEQADLMEESMKLPSGKHRFCVSTQHYSFCCRSLR